MKPMKCVAVGAAMAACATAAHAQSLTTLFASNGGGSAGGGVYFDVTVGGTPITITGFDTNTSSTSAFGFRVFAVPNATHAGNEADPAFWGSPVATGNGTGMGTDTPSPVVLDNTFLLSPNTQYAFAISLSDAAGGNAANHRYTNGTGANQLFFDANLRIELGSATNVLFSGSAFTPRVWNGTIHYIPTPGTLAMLGLGGLVALRRRR